MMVHTYDAGGKSAKPHDCGCGCGGQCGCESRCCDLECLVRPNFFCGQLLTDTDLGAMVEWARKRFALTRYRHGWGVVCGLDVTCSAPHGAQSCCPDPNAGPTVYVNPGYAIDCCGNDLVVCEPIAVDLSKVCRPPEDPCNELPKEKKDAAGKTGGTSRDGNGQEVPPNCWDVLSSGLVAVDLTLRYHEDLAQGQRPMFRSGCSDVGPCEYTRVLEHPCVYAKRGSLDLPHRADDWQGWDADFDKHRQTAWNEITTAVTAGDPATALQYLRRHRPYRFCFLEELVCCLQPSPQLWREGFERIRFWLYFDWFLHQLECPCWSCRPDEGVPLARVLLKPLVVGGKPQCKVVFIDTSAPYRRPLRKDDCRPIPPGAIDLAPYLWQRSDYATQSLQLLGVTATPPPVANSEADLVGKLDRRSLWLGSTAGRNLNVHVVKDPFGVDRIAAFEPAA